MTSQKSKFVVVTNAYHVFRAVLIAKDAGLDCMTNDHGLINIT